jgi:hypothetical protein
VTELVNSTTTSTAIRALLESLIDYAGLFPPAGLAMDAAVANYARYKNGEYAWMLGRFIVPAARLSEFEQAWSAAGSPEGWMLSALIANRDEELEQVPAFNAKHEGRMQIDAVELKATSVAEIEEVPGVTAYVELPTNNEPTQLISALKHETLRAKIRTGGVKADSFPSVSDVARFIRACAGMHVAFKATAGLHHPVRCVKPFTYEANSEQGTMHGFLNVFVAAEMARRGYATLLVEQVLSEEDPRAFRFQGETLQWKDAKFNARELAGMRANLAIAFGSCSFEEPVADLQALGLLR